MSRISTRSFRPSDVWQRQHLNLLNAIVHGFSAFDELPQSFRERMSSVFFDACCDCRCPKDYVFAVFSVLTCRCDCVAASVDYFVSPSVIHKWRRRVIIVMARNLLSEASARYDV